MPLIGGVIMPHGALILDPTRSEMPKELSTSAKKLHDACVAAADAIEAQRPDLILLYTPHGLIADGVDMNIYTNESASGSCEWMGSWAEHRVAVRCDKAAAESLVDTLKNAGCSAASLCAFSGYDAPLRWGEAVPLSFLRRVTARPGGAGARTIILSHGPSSTGVRCELAAQRIEATKHMGATISEWCAGRTERILLLISGDLAHTHGNDRAPLLGNGEKDPRYLNPKYPVADPSAMAFERAIQFWILHRHWESLRTHALNDMPKALCCGYEGFVMLHTALRLHESSCAFVPKLFAHEVPVYYGMLVATFLPATTPTAAASSEPPAKRSRSDTNGGPSSALAHSLAPPPLPPRLATLDFVGKSVLVSGAGHGFGRAIALSFASLGAVVSACDGPGALAEAELAETAKLSGGLRGTITTNVVDFREMEQVSSWVASHEAIDVLVLNAGGVLGHKGGPVEEASQEAWDAIFDVNAKAAFVAAQAASPMLKRSEAGRIVTISSGAGLRPSLTGIHAYCAAKHALVGLTKQLALELGAFGITVNSVAPGFVRSNANSEAQWQAYGEAGQAALVKGIFTRRLGDVEDIADAVLFFASRAASWVTGQVLSVDGGRA